MPSPVFNLQDELFSEKLGTIFHYQPNYPDMEYRYSLFASHRAMNLQVSRKKIEEVMMMTRDEEELEQTSTRTDSQGNEFYSDKSLQGITTSSEQESKGE